MRRIKHGLAWLITILVALSALLLVVFRLDLLGLEQYKADVELLISEQVGQPVSIGRFAARIEGFTPQIRLLNVQVGSIEPDKKLAATRIAEVRLVLPPVADFIRGEWLPKKIILLGTAISLKRFKDGHIELSGMPVYQPSQKNQSTADFAWLLEGTEIQVLNSQLLWADETRQVDDLLLSEINLTLKNKGNSHQVDLLAASADQLFVAFRLSLKITGNVLSAKPWSLKGYLKSEGLQLERFSQRFAQGGFSVQEGVANIESWLEMDQNKLLNMQGRVAIDQLNLAYAEKAVALQTISANFKWLNKAEGGQLYITGLNFLSPAGIAQQDSKLSAAYTGKAPGDLQLEVLTESLNLAAISSVLADAHVLAEEHRLLLKGFDVKGIVSTAQLNYQLKNEVSDWQLCSSFKDVASLPHKGTPGVLNLSGQLCSNDTQGWLALDSSKITLTFESLFREPLSNIDLNGNLHWQKESKGWRINSDSLTLVSPEISTQTRLKMLLASPQRPAYLDMQTNFSAADSAHVPHFLPVGIMPNSVVSWLDSALQGGKVTGGGMLFKGEVKGFPFRNNSGLFQVLFNTDNIHLKYDPAWPATTGVSAEVEFKNESMTIDSSKGKVGQSEIKQARVAIKDMGSKSSYLAINGRLADDMRGMYHFFRHSPINDKVSGLLESSEVSGLAEIELAIKVPLRKGQTADVKAQVELSKASLEFPAWHVNMTDVNGVVNFANSAWSSQNLSARYLDQAVKLKLDSDKQHIKLTAQARLAITALEKAFAIDSKNLVKGKTKIKLELLIPQQSPSASKPINLSFKSDLKGLLIDLPKPFGKLKSQAKPSVIRLQLAQKDLPVQFSYANHVQGNFLLKESAKTGLFIGKGDLRLGKNRPQLPKGNGLRLSGLMNEFKADDWQPVFKLFQSKGSSSVLNQLDLKVKKLAWSGYLASNMTLTGSHKKSAWQGRIKSDQLQGSYYLADDLMANSAIRLQLDKLVINKQEMPDAAGDKDKTIDPRQLPNLDLNAQQFILDGSNLGELSLLSQRTEKGLELVRLSLRSARDHFSAKGAWELQNGVTETRLIGELKSDSFAALLSDAGLSSDMAETAGSLNFDLMWPDMPQKFSKDIINGMLHIRTEQGRILNLEPGVGRVFGVFSLGTLSRRLSLDFSDLIAKGFSFDKIKGSYRLVAGDALTEQFYIDSPAARLNFSGKIGLKKEDLNLLVTVSPKATESLPLASALVGGPLVGAAVFIAQKFAGNAVDKIITYQYKINGLWSDPQMKQISVPGMSFIGDVADKVLPNFDK